MVTMIRDVRLNVRMEEAMFSRLRDQAKTESRTISEIIRHLVIDYLIARENGTSLIIGHGRSKKVEGDGPKDR